MKRLSIAVVATCALATAALTTAADKAAAPADPTQVAIAPTDWPWWRGPHQDGIASADQTPPLKWSATEGVLWKSLVPGRGHGSPTVCGDRVFLATCETQPPQQSVVCYDRKTGNRLWKTDVHHGGIATDGMKVHAKASMASATVACDGNRAFINFLNNGAVYTTALSLDGKILWQKKINDYTLHQGFGSSPTIYGANVIVSNDNKSGGVIVALSRETGDVVWKIERPKAPNHISPIILTTAGRDQLLLTGLDRVSSFDPLTGTKLWETAGSTSEIVTSPVTDGKLVFSSGGFPKKHVAAFAADGSGKLVWENNSRVYCPSMLVRDGYLYAVLDAGVAMCWKSDTGENVWTNRLGGNFTASPVLVGDKIFATNDSGRTFIFKANPKEFELLAENSLGDDVSSTPTICGSRIYMRVADTSGGKRQEVLYCIGDVR